MSYENPYAPPQTEVGVVETTAVGMLRDSPERVPAGHGWRWLADGFSLFKASPLIWWAVLLLYILTMVLLMVIPQVGGLLQVLVSPLFTAGLMVGAQSQDRGRNLEVADLFAGFQRRPGALAALGLMSLVGTAAVLVVAGMVSGVGFATMIALQGGGDIDPAQMQAMLPLLLVAFAAMMLLMVPLMMLLWFAPALIVLHEEVGVFTAMKLSFVACLKNVLPFSVYGLIGLVLSILATVLLGLGWLVLLPMIVASMYTAYKDIFIE